MKRILEETVPPVVFEFVPWVCKSIQDPISFLQGFPTGYKLYEINDRTAKLGEISKCDKSNFIKELSARNLPYTDLLLLHENSLVIDPADFENQ